MFKTWVALMALALAGLAVPAVAQDQPDYRDDRSTPQSVIESFYNAISRHEFARAWSYYEDGVGVASFNDFAKGYASTAAVSVNFGEAAEEGAAGSIYYTVPVSIDAVNDHDDHTYFSGCYTLRLVNPQMQEDPPFRPLHIVEGHLRKTSGFGAAFAPAKCGQ